MPARKWVFIVYKVPHSSSSKRVFVWRKLKRLGACALQDAVFVLPHNEKTFEQFHWLAAEIVDMNGEASVWVSTATTDLQEKDVVKRFTDSLIAEYSEVMEGIAELQGILDLPERETALSKVIKAFSDIRYHDYFHPAIEGEIKIAISKEIKNLSDAKYQAED